METYPLLKNKVALVTGAAMGMGEATAKLFAEAQAKVAVVDFNDEKGQKVTKEIQESGGEAYFVHADISNSDDVRNMIQEIIEKYHQLDVAVNNAALTPDNALASAFDEDYWDKLMSIDLKGTALCMKYELQQLIKQDKGGSIINISSVSGFRPQPYNLAYVSAKHGVRGMTKVAALENGQYNIRVNSVAPGAVDTPMLRGALKEQNVTLQEEADALSELKRLADPIEIAQASLFLASDMASYITGTTINVDAGYTNM